MSQPSCSASQSWQCQNQQCQAPVEWHDTFQLHSPQPYYSSVAAYDVSNIGPATAAAACTAALAQILDSFGGPSISVGWDRLAQGSCSPSTAVSSTSNCCPSAMSHEPSIEDLQCFQQQAMQGFLPGQHSALNSPSVDILCHTRHAAHLVISSSPIFDQPRSYRLPATDSALPIWGLDVPPYADANVREWSDASALTYIQQGSVQTLRSSQWHESNQELPLLSLLPLPLPFTVPNLDTQLATRLVTTPAAAASAGAATAAASAHVDTGTSDDSKPKKKKGIATISSGIVFAFQEKLLCAHQGAEVLMLRPGCNAVCQSLSFWRPSDPAHVSWVNNV